MPPRLPPSTAAHGTLRRGFGVLGRGIREQPGPFAIAVLGAAIYGTGTVGTGYLLGRITDSVLAPAFAAGRIDAGELWRAAGVLAVVAVVTALAVAVRRIFAGLTSINLQAHYRQEVSAQYLRLPLSWHQRHPTGQLLSNASSDIEASFTVFNPLPFAIGVIVMLGFAGVAMVLADPVLAAVGLTVLPALAAVNVVFQRVVAPKVVRAQQLRARVASVAHESFDGALVVKALGREQEETERFAVEADRLREANVAIGRTRGVFDPVIEMLPVLGTLAVLALGTWRVDSGAARAGDVVQVAYLLSLLAFPVRAIGWVLGDLPRAAVGWGRVDAVLKARGRMPHGRAQLDGERPVRLHLDDVTYGYLTGTSGDLSEDPLAAAEPDEAADEPQERVQVLHNIGLAVPSGATIAVVGPTGSGKSTLASLVVRLVDPDGGQVLIDDLDARSLRAGEIAGSVALVSQSTFIFDDTVRGNITLGATGPGGLELDDDLVWHALRLAQADRFVAALPSGLDTRVGERGASLSGGQRQRIALARALVRRPRLLVLDDATSAVDPRVEQAILAGLRERRDGVTVLVVAYRKATIALADEVVFIERGRVVDRGRHKELLERRRRYRHLVNAYEERRREEAAQ